MENLIEQLNKQGFDIAVRECKLNGGYNILFGKEDKETALHVDRELNLEEFQKIVNDINDKFNEYENK